MLLPTVPTRSARRWTRVLALVFGLAALWLCTRDQDFPYFYHPDESSKITQVLRQDYHFHHPLLLLRATEGLARTTDTPRTAQATVEKGRLASAIFAALAVGGVVLIAGRFAGRGAAALAGALALTHPVLFAHAHYMKEDCALLMGVIATATALVYYGAQPTIWRAALVGLGAGLAVSGKYLGAAMALTALAALAFQKAETVRRGIAVLVATATMIACFAVINFPSLSNADKAGASLAKDSEEVEKGPDESIQFEHLSTLGTTLSVPLLIGLGYWTMRRWRLRRHEPLAWRMLGFFVGGYFILVSVAPNPTDRDLLPVYILACALGAAGLAEWWRHYRKHRQPVTRLIPRVIAAVALGLHLPGLAAAYEAFQHDDRRQLAAWISANTVPEEVIAQDARVMLSQAKEAALPGFVLANALLAPPDRYVADLGSIAELRAKRVAYIAVCEADYHHTVKRGNDRVMGARARWYAELFANHSLVWQSRADAIAYLQPGLRLYKITP